MARLLHIGGLGSYIPSYAANTIQVMKMAGAFSACGYDVTLVVPAGSRDLDRRHRRRIDPFTFYGTAPTFRIARLPLAGGGGRLAVLAFVAQAVVRAKRGPWDLIFTRSEAASIGLARAGITHVFEAHRFRQEGSVDRAHLPIARSGRVEALVALNSEVSAAYAEHGVERAKILVAPDATDPPASPLPSPKPDVHARRRLLELSGLDDTGDLTVVYAGTLGPLKGTDLLLEVARITPEVSFVLIGGPDERTILRYRHLATKLGNVRIAGSVEPSFVPALLAGADVLVLPHTRVSNARYVSPLKIFEYMAAGRPIVASELRATRDVITDGEQAVLVPPDDPAAVASALRRLRDDPQLIQRLAEGARLAAARHTWERRAEAILEHVAARRQPCRRRIVHVLNSFHPSIGGAERQAAALAQRQAAAGDEVNVVTRGVAGTAPQDGLGPIRVHRVGVPWLAGIGFIAAAWWWVWRHRRFDVLHAHQAHSGAIVAALAPRRAARRTAVKLAGLDVPRGSGVRASIKRWALRRIDVVVAVNEDLYRATRHEGVDHVRLLPNGVDADRFVPGDDRLALRRGLGIDARQCLVLYVGRLESVKGVDSLTAAWDLVSDQAPDARLVIVGGGSLAGALADGAPAGVRFAGPAEDPLPYYQAADILVLPSRWEGLSNVLLEGMACGLAVVGTAISGHEGVIEDGVDGRLAKPDDPESIARSIVELIRDPGERQRLGAAARRKVLARYRLETIEQRWAHLYESG